MIGFFRRIRKKLADDNQFLKYSRYAVGEILLVVVGILIAIQLNTVKNNSDQRKEEIIHLKNILSDLKQDKTELDKIIERRKAKSTSAAIMEGYYHSNKVLDLNEYYSNWTNVLYWEAHNPSFVTFKELINSGKLSMLSNDRVKQLLLQIDYKYSEVFEVREHMYDDYSEYLYSPLADIIDYENAIVTWAEPGSSIKLSRDDAERALKSKRIKNGFTLARFNNDLLTGLLSDISAKVDSTIYIVEQEIRR
jgi:hypothetical protein